MAATRYRNLEAPSLIDVGARATSTGAANASDALAQKFAAFSRTAADVGSLAVHFGAQKQAELGASEGLAGKPRFRKGIRSLTAYGDAYNNSALRGYAIQAEADVNETAARLEIEAGTNPDKFKTSMEAVRLATMTEAPPEAKAMIDELYERRIGSGAARIQGALAAELRDEDRTVLSEGIQQHVERISFLKSQDDDVSVFEAVEEEIKLNLLIDGAANTGALSTTEADMLRRTAGRDVIFGTVRERFKNELSDPNGDPVSMIEAVKEIVRQDQSLTPEEEAKLEAELFAELRDHNALRSYHEAQMVSEGEARYAAGDQYATELLLAGQLTRSKLLQMVELDQLKPTVARTLQNELDSPTRLARSNQEELAHVEINLLSMTEDDILTNQELVHADRARLILKRRDEAAGWKGTQAAREAFDRIDRALGIAPGTELLLLTDAEKEARDTALTELYDVIDALPPEERQAALMPKSIEVVNTRIRDNGRIEAENLRRRLDEYKADVGDVSELDSTQRSDYDKVVGNFERQIQEALSQGQR